VCRGAARKRPPDASSALIVNVDKSFFQHRTKVRCMNIVSQAPLILITGGSGAYFLAFPNVPPSWYRQTT
jgi:hypothetical protein